MTAQPQGQWAAGDGHPDPAVLQKRIAELEKTIAKIAGIGPNHDGQPVPPEVAARIAEKGTDEWYKRQGVRWADDAERGVSLADVPERPGQALADFLASAPPALEFEIPGLVPRQSRVIITGEEGAGKSTLGRFVAMHHAAGVHPFSSEPYDGGVSVLLDCENPVGLQQMRLAELRETLGEEAAAAAEKRLVPVSEPGGIDLASPWWQEYLLRLVSGWEATLLVIGPLYKLCAAYQPMSEEFFTAISEFLDRLRELGCSLWIEAHCRQPAAGQLVRDIFPYGNTGWRRWPEAGMHLGRTGMLADWRDNRYGTNVSWPLRLARVPGSQVLWQAEYGMAAGITAAGNDAAAEVGKFREIRAAVTENPGISLAGLRTAVRDDGTWIRRAVAAGAIIEHKAGRNSGKRNSYEVRQEWTGAAGAGGSLLLPDGRHNFQHLWEIADHTAWLDES